MRAKFLIIAAMVVGLAAAVMFLGPEVLSWWQNRHITQPLDDKEISRAMSEWHGAAVPAVVAVPAVSLNRNVRLALGNFNLADIDLERRLSDLVLVQLSGAAGLDLVERQALEQAMREQDLSTAGLVRAKDAIRVGKLLQVDWFLLSSSTRLNETNYCVARIVDARTGVLREAGFFVQDQNATQLATELAGFVKQSRQHAAKAEIPTYLSVGGFGNLGVNTRQADFPTQLRAYLLAAYRESNVIMLEREFAEILLKEVWLDLAGLTEEAAASGAPMQSAYWIVDGGYQSYETTGLEVELQLDIQRMFGRSQHVLLRDKPGEPLFKQVKLSIDATMRKDRAAVTPTRITEVRVQMGKGKELARLAAVSLLHADVYQRLDVNAAAIQRRNVEEALRAFQAVLLLSPTNREAKMYVAACLRNPSLRRDWEAREIYQEILDEPVSDQWVGQAQQALIFSFNWLASADEKARWYARAQQRGSNSPAAEFYRLNAVKAADEATIANGTGDQVVELAEAELRAVIRANQESAETRGWVPHGDYGMYQFCRAFKGDKAAAAAALARQIPKWEQEFPKFMPHLVARALYFQTDTNTPLVTEYLKQLEECRQRPNKVFAAREFWNSARFFAYEWLMNSGFPEAAVRTMESYKAATDAAGKQKYAFEERDWVALVYAHMAAKEWSKALAICESLPGKSVRMDGDGPWGKAFYPVSLDQLAARCREKIGLPVERDSFELELSENRICLHEGSDFRTTSDGLWLAVGDKLLKLGFDLQTNLAVQLPQTGGTPITCMAFADQKVWVGTGGGGLIEYDAGTRSCRRFDESAGLLLNHVSALCATDSRLWIGYGGDAGGGLGMLDLSTGKVFNFMRSLEANAKVGATVGPPKAPVGNLTSDGRADRLLMTVVGESGLRQFHFETNHWESIPSKNGEWVGCFAVSPKGIFAGVSVQQIEITVTSITNSGTGTSRNMIISPEEEQRLRASLKTNRQDRISHTGSGAIRPKGEMIRWNPVDQRWRLVCAPAGLPAPASACLLADDSLWVGGEGYVALIDLRENQIRKTFRVKTQGVDRIQIGGGYVWAKFDKHLHRARL